MKHRLDYIDIAKSIAIISVVVGHILFFVLYGVENIEDSVLFCVVDSYHNSLFMFLSGMVSVTAVEITKIPSDIYKRFRRLIVPALVIGIPYTYYSDANIFTDFFSNTWKFGYWYLFVLFTLYMICYPFALLSLRYTKWVYLLIVPIWIFIFRHTYAIPQILNNTLSIDLVVKFFPYFFLGSIVKRHNLYEKLFTLPVFCGCLTIVILQGVIYKITGKYLVNYIVTTAEILSIITLCKWGGQFLKTNWLNYMGRNTLYIYVFHYYAIKLMELPAAHKWFALNGSLYVDFLAVVGPTLVAIIYSLLLKNLLMRIPSFMKYVFHQS